MDTASVSYSPASVRYPRTGAVLLGKPKMPPGYELKSPEPGGFRHILFSFRRAQRLQLLNNVANIIRASAGQDARKRKAQPR